MKCYSIILLLISIEFITANVYYCNETDAEGLKIGKNATLCIHFQELGKRIAFKVEVDQYSVVSIAGGFNLALQSIGKEKPTNPEEKITTTNFLAQIGNNVTAFPSIYYKSDTESLYPLMNLVIKVNEGKLTDIVWDNDCFACETSNTCENSTIFNYTNSSITSEYKNCKVETLCNKKTEDGIKCDPKFYITWFGTDADKRQLKSSNLAMSKFKQYSIGSLYNSAKGIYDNASDKVKDLWKKSKDAIGKILE